MIHPEDWTFYTPTSDQLWDIAICAAVIIVIISVVFF